MTMDDAPTPAASPRWGALSRAWIALPLAITGFAVPYVATWPLANVIQPELDGWGSLAYIATLLVFGLAVVWVAIPVVVLTLGRLLDARTLDWSAGRRIGAFTAVGATLGLVLAVVVALATGYVPWVPLVNFGLAGAAGGAVTSALLPVVMRSRAARIVSIVLAVLVLMAPVLVWGSLLLAD